MGEIDERALHARMVRDLGNWKFAAKHVRADIGTPRLGNVDPTRFWEITTTMIGCAASAERWAPPEHRGPAIKLRLRLQEARQEAENERCRNVIFGQVLPWAEPSQRLREELLELAREFEVYLHAHRPKPPHVDAPPQGDKAHESRQEPMGPRANTAPKRALSESDKKTIKVLQREARVMKFGELYQQVGPSCEEANYRRQLARLAEEKRIMRDGKSRYWHPDVASETAQ